MVSWNVTKCDIYFSIDSHAVDTPLPFAVAVLGSLGENAIVILINKVINSLYDVIVTANLAPDKCFSCWGTDDAG